MTKSKCGRFRSANKRAVELHEVKCAACAKKYAGLTP